MPSANDITPIPSQLGKQIDCNSGEDADDNGENCQYNPFTSTSMPNNVRAPKRPAHRLPWPRSKICSYDISENSSMADKKVRAEGDSRDDTSDSDASSIVPCGLQSKIEACLLNENVEVCMLKTKDREKGGGYYNRPF